jgi:hypothetical protein
MSREPRQPGLRPGWAAGIESGLQRRLLSRRQRQSQPCDASRVQAQQRLRRQRHAQQLHRLGERALHEFVEELRRHHPEIAVDIDARLARYADVDPRLLTALGGDKFAPLPLHIVGSAP